MACPLRVLATLIIGTIFAGMFAWEIYRNGDEEVGVHGACARLREVMHPRKAWAALRRPSLWSVLYILVVLLHVLVYVDVVLFDAAATTLLVGEERLHAVVKHPLVMTVAGAMPRFSFGDGAVFSGSGCYWENGRWHEGKRIVPPHTCTYEAEVCCPEGCEALGGQWIWGAAAPTNDKQSAEAAASTGMAASYATQACSRGCADVVCEAGGAE